MVLDNSAAAIRVLEPLLEEISALKVRDSERRWCTVVG